MSAVVTGLVAREVLDCRGLPTVQVDLALEDGTVATSSIGLLIAFVVAGLLYALLAPRLSPERRMAAR